MIMLVLKKCNGDWGSALPQFARNLAPTLTTTTATRLSVQTESRRCANPPWFNRSLGWWNWVPKCSGFFWGGSNDFAGPNKFTDPTNFWIQFVFGCKHFLDPTCFLDPSNLLDPRKFWNQSIQGSLDPNISIRGYSQIFDTQFEHLSSLWSASLSSLSSASLSSLLSLCGPMAHNSRYVGRWPRITSNVDVRLD